MYNPQLHAVKRRKSNFPWVPFSLGFFVVVGLSLYFLLPILNKDESLINQSPFTICNYSVNKTQDTLESLSYSDTIQMHDYLVYGETLNIFAQNYVLNQKDTFIGKTVKLINLCDGYEWVYMLEGNIDGQIPLELLPNGFYEVYIIDNLIQKRVISSLDIEDIFYPVNRNNQGKTIEILSDLNLGSSEDRKVSLDKRYLYLSVKDSTSEERETVYDIVLDGANSTYIGQRVDRGKSAFNMVESNETVRMAILVQEELEAAGLKVYMTRDDSEDVIDLYGIDGRLYNAYASKAKYYLEFNMLYSSLAERSGAVMSYSHFSSNRFATAVFKSYLNANIISAYGSASSSNIAGVKSASLYEGFDSIPVIRESGGRILGAGTMSEASLTNASFNADARYGLQTISLDLIHLSNENDAMLYANNTEALAHAIAQGIIEYIRLEGQS